MIHQLRGFFFFLFFWPAECKTATALPAATPPLATGAAAAIPAEVKPTAPRTIGAEITAVPETRKKHLVTGCVKRFGGTSKSRPFTKTDTGPFRVYFLYVEFRFCYWWAFSGLCFGKLQIIIKRWWWWL